MSFRDGLSENQRDKQKEETRSRLISAGAEVFGREGLKGARISDIARTADVAMGTLYTHFEDKNELFAEVIRSGKSLVMDGLIAARSMGETRETRDRNAMAGVVLFAEHYSGLFRLLMSRGRQENALQAEVIEAIVALREEELREGLNEGWVRAGVEPVLAARCEVGTVFHLLDWWLQSDRTKSRDEIIDTLTMMRRYGVEGQP
jgi:Transcriptional regulator